MEKPFVSGPGKLINIAHPDFRMDLEKQAKELHYL